MSRKLIFVSGADGSGKTSIIELLQARLHDEGISTRYQWLRYNHLFVKPLLGLCRLLRLTRYVTTNGVTVGYHDFFRSKIVSYLFIWLTYLDTARTAFSKVLFTGTPKSPLVICDRWIVDILVDLEIDTKIRVSQTRLARLFWKLVPADARYFVIMRNTEAMVACRPENQYDARFSDRLQAYQRLANNPRVTLISNDGPLEATADQILSSLAD